MILYMYLFLEKKVIVFARKHKITKISICNSKHKIINKKDYNKIILFYILIHTV